VQFPAALHSLGDEQPVQLTLLAEESVISVSISGNRVMSSGKSIRFRATDKSIGDKSNKRDFKYLVCASRVPAFVVIIHLKKLLDPDWSKSSAVFM